MTRPCRECSSPFNPISAGRHGLISRPDQEFCSSSCRLVWHNRRKSRGAELYDLFRALRRERRVAGELDLWTAICRLETKWHEEDEGRVTYAPPRESLMKLVDAGRISRAFTPKQAAEIDTRRADNNRRVQQRKLAGKMEATA